MSFNTNRWTQKSGEAFNEAQGIAERIGNSTVEPEHLLLALLNQADGTIPQVFAKLQIASGQLIQQVNAEIQKFPRASGGNVQLTVSARLRGVLMRAHDELALFNDEYVHADLLLVALFEKAGGGVERVLKAAGLTREKLLAVLREVRGGQRVTSPNPEGTFGALDQYGRDLTDLARKGKLDPVIGRDEEIRRVVQTLSRRTKNNPVLIGDPGVGKTAIVEGLAQRIIKEDVPEALKGSKVIALDLAAMIAGAKYRGEFEERLKAVLKEIQDRDDIVIFIDELHTVVGAGAAEGAMDAGNMLKPMLARGELHMVGATTLDEYRKHIEKDAALERRFQPIVVNPPTVEDTISILRGLKERYEAHHGVRITDSALVAAATLSDRYINDRFLPDKAIDLVDEAAARLRMEITSKPQELDDLDRKIILREIEQVSLRKETDKGSKDRLGKLEQELANLKEQRNAIEGRLQSEREVLTRIAKLKEQIERAHNDLEQAQRSQDWDRAAVLRNGLMPQLQRELEALEQQAQANEGSILRQEVSAQDVAEVVAKWSGVPVSNLLEGEIEKLIHMEERLHLRVIGQDEAVRAVSNAVRRARAGLQDPHRPLGSFLFLGPTGVGKTELARALAEFLFDDEQATVRIDMSEYMEKHTVARLIGAPPGYIGYDEGGQLTEAVRRKPYSVILLDEIEKAHTDVFNVLLQVLDDGRLTDGQGRVVNFKNTVVIMTSNIASPVIQELTRQGASEEEVRREVFDELKNEFRPEFLNRIDETIVFRPLGREQIGAIVEIQIGRLRKLLADRKITLELSQATRERLGSEGYDPALGARPLKRTIQQRIQNPLALALLQGQFHNGDTIVVDVIGGQFEFEKVAVGEVTV